MRSKYKLIVTILLLFICISTPVFTFALTTTNNNVDFTYSGTNRVTKVRLNHQNINGLSPISVDGVEDCYVYYEFGYPFSLSVNSAANSYINRYIKFSGTFTATFASTIDKVGQFSLKFRNNSDKYLIVPVISSQTSTTNSITTKYNFYVFSKNIKVTTLLESSNSWRELFTDYIDFSLGAYFLNTAPTAQQTNVNFTSSFTQDTSSAYYYFTYGDAEVDNALSVSIADAINNCTDVDTIISILNSIKSDTALLSQVLTNVEQINTKLSQAITQLIALNGYADIRNSILLALLTALSGSSDQLNVSDNTINWWTTIIRNALEDPSLQNQESQVQENISDAQGQLNNAEQELEITTAPADVVVDNVDSILTSHQDDITKGTEIFSVFSSNILTSILIIVFTLAILSYILYGGK